MEALQNYRNIAINAPPPPVTLNNILNLLQDFRDLVYKMKWDVNTAILFEEHVIKVENECGYQAGPPIQTNRMTGYLAPPPAFSRIPDTPIIFPVFGMSTKRAPDLNITMLAPPPQTWDSTVLPQQQIAVQTSGVVQRAQQPQAQPLDLTMYRGEQPPQARLPLPAQACFRPPPPIDLQTSLPTPLTPVYFQPGFSTSLHTPPQSPCTSYTTLLPSPMPPVCATVTQTAPTITTSPMPPVCATVTQTVPTIATTALQASQDSTVSNSEDIVIGPLGVNIAMNTPSRNSIANRQGKSGEMVNIITYYYFRKQQSIFRSVLTSSTRLHTLCIMMEEGSG